MAFTCDAVSSATGKKQSVVRRVDARAGTVHVHFPRFGFQIKKGTARV
jgi:hypothetical protein